MPAIPVLIPDETLAKLEAKAAQAGIDLDAYLSLIVMEHAHGADEALRMLMPAIGAGEGKGKHGG